MLHDPEMIWPEGPFPYDALRGAGITPDSTHREVGDASFTLMEQDAFEGEARTAWDSLRIVERRLWVDFLLFEGSPEQIGRQLCEFANAGDPPRFALEPPWEELGRMELALQPFQAGEEPVSAPPDVWLATGAGPEVEFDG